jgi:hypothetical protein
MNFSGAAVWLVLIGIFPQAVCISSAASEHHHKDFRGGDESSLQSSLLDSGELKDVSELHGADPDHQWQPSADHLLAAAPGPLGPLIHYGIVSSRL